MDKLDPRTAGSNGTKEGLYTLKFFGVRIDNMLLSIHMQLETKNANNNYINEHPELRLIIAMFLKRVQQIFVFVVPGVVECR